MKNFITNHTNKRIKNQRMTRTNTNNKIIFHLRNSLFLLFSFFIILFSFVMCHDNPWIIELTDHLFTCEKVGHKWQGGVCSKCGENEPVVPATGVSLSHQALILQVGKTGTLTATVTPSQAKQAVTWSSSDTAVATVSNGVVTAVAVGNATITVTSVDGGFTDTCSVTVNPFVPDTYTVNITANTSVMGDASASPTSATAGTSITVTATPNGGYQFKNWTASPSVTFADANSASTTFTMPSSDVTVTANFEPIPTYGITVNFNTMMGTATATVGGTIVTSATAGTSITLTATPNSGYHFVNWTTTSSGVTFANANSATTTFAMPASNVTITVKFASNTITGSGTSDDPYILSLPEHLEEIRTNLTAHFKLDADIDLSHIPNWTPIVVFSSSSTPNGNDANSFRGTFDGNGYTINGITIRATNICRGLFGYVGIGGVVKNLGVTNITVTPNSTADAPSGGIAGISYGTISNCYVTGNLDERANTGGIVGNHFTPGIVEYCYSIVTTRATNATQHAGGIIGRLYSGTVRNSVALGPSVTAPVVGRIAGVTGTTGTFLNNYARSDMTGSFGTIANNINDRNGGSITATEWGNPAWWTNPANWNGAPWDEAIWDFSGVGAGSYPTLRPQSP